MAKALTEPGGIYLHIPFCVQKCAYCDFYSRTDLHRMSSFVNALMQEMHLFAGVLPGPFDTLYFGGGTPTVLGPERIQVLIDSIRSCFPFLPDAEITLEANPGTLTAEDLAAYRRIGVNRLHIGIQSFRDENLRFLGRIHRTADAVAAVKAARRAGFENIGLDLIYGLPNQTPDDWRFDLKTAASLAPEHLSCYMLSYEPGTPLDRRRLENKIRPLPDRKIGDLYGITLKVLADHGYTQYEISNFSRSPALQSRHNRKYWRHVPYLGLGPSAHSYIPPRRYWNSREMETYIRKLEQGAFPAEGEEILTPEQQMMESFYLGLRQNEGFLIADFEGRFGIDFRKRFDKVVSELSDNGWLVKNGGRCALTPPGMLLLDAIVSRFIEAM